MKKHTILLERLVYTLRNPTTPRAQFRETLEKTGEYLGSCVADLLPSKEQEITTELGARTHHLLLEEQPVLITILRAGLPLYQGVQRAFPDADAGFIGAMRNEKTLRSTISYKAIPNLQERTVILIDTMIATGGSIVDTLDMLKEQKPRRIYVLCAIASRRGIEHINSYDPAITIISATIDPELNAQGYIVPGLGEAGDRSFGRKQ